MSTDLLEPVSALAHRAPMGAPGAVRVAELRLWALSILRGDADALGGAIREGLNVDLPREACRAGEADEAAALWLGPDEWMLVSPKGLDARHAALDDALAGRHHQRVDVSDHYTLIELRGTRVRSLLAKLVTLDLHPSAFRPGDVKGTALAAAQTYLWCVEDDRFRLTARRSFADYVWCLIAHAGHEWGLPEQRPRGGERLTPPEN